MKFVAPIARILLGLVFVVFGINYFVPFMPAQPPPPPEALPLLGGLVASKMLTFVKIIEIGAGVLLLANRFVPLATAVLAPIVIAITFVHVMLVPSGLLIAVVLVALELALAWSYRSAFAPMLRAKVIPDTAPVETKAKHLAVA